MQTVEPGVHVAAVEHGSQITLVAVDRLIPSCPTCGEPLPRPEGAERPTLDAFAVACGRGFTPHWQGRARFWAKQPEAAAVAG